MEAVAMNIEKKHAEELEMIGLGQLQQHADLFNELTIRKNVNTFHRVISAIISYDSKFTIAILRDT